MSDKDIVLIVDDCPTNRKIIQILLHQNDKDLIIDEVADGVEVIKLMEEKKQYDLIFIDVQMPIMDGIECTKELREKYNYKNSIIGITSYADNESITNCLNSGMTDVMTKPITREIIKKFYIKYKIDK